jgi:hypothetical protein
VGAFLCWDFEKKDFVPLDNKSLFLENMDKYIVVDVPGERHAVAGTLGYRHSEIFELFRKRNPEAILLGGGFVVVCSRLSKFCVYSESDTYGAESRRSETIECVAMALGFKSVEENVATYIGYVSDYYINNKDEEFIPGVAEFELAKKQKGYFESWLRGRCREGFVRMFALM